MASVITEMTGGYRWLQGVDEGGVETRVGPPGVWVTDRETQLMGPGLGTEEMLLAGSL